jgi:hypothetical protein
MNRLLTMELGVQAVRMKCDPPPLPACWTIDRNGKGTTMNRSEVDEPVAVEIAADASSEHRRSFRELYRRYQYLSRSSSAADQRERLALQAPLMELYRLLHPATFCVHLEDDFDAVMRAQRRA